MINIEDQYRALMASLLQAPKKEDRTGVGTKSVFGRQLEHDMSIRLSIISWKENVFQSCNY